MVSGLFIKIREWPADRPCLSNLGNDPLGTPNDSDDLLVGSGNIRMSLYIERHWRHEPGSEHIRNAVPCHTILCSIMSGTCAYLTCTRPASASYSSSSMQVSLYRNMCSRAPSRTLTQCPEMVVATTGFPLTMPSKYHSTPPQPSLHPPTTHLIQSTALF